MKKILSTLIILASLMSTDSKAQTTVGFFDEADAFFKMYVSNGRIDYAGIYRDPTSLNSLVRKLEKLTVGASNASVYKAFWINAYNLTVIKGVINNYPVESPLDVEGFFDKISYKIGGASLTLNDIENKKLRAEFDEPRFHFVLVCGAMGCPPIISEAYKPARLEEQLKRQTRKALNDPSFIQVSGTRVGLSEIFRWYREDFVRDGKNELDFINTFRKERIPESAKISYYPYNWMLNSK